jgi:hypothetical protein
MGTVIGILTGVVLLLIGVCLFLLTLCCLLYQENKDQRALHPIQITREDDDFEIVEPVEVHRGE